MRKKRKLVGLCADKIGIEAKLPRNAVSSPEGIKVNIDTNRAVSSPSFGNASTTTTAAEINNGLPAARGEAIAVLDNSQAYRVPSGKDCHWY